MNKELFSRWGWICVPSSLAGLTIVLLAVAFCGTVVVAVDRHSHSVSDTFYGVYPYVACTFLVVDWVGPRTSDPEGS